jgi:hypothetical protein
MAGVTVLAEYALEGGRLGRLQSPTKPPRSRIPTSSSRFFLSKGAASCVDGPRFARVFRVMNSGRLQSCVRPFSAVLHDRWP